MLEFVFSGAGFFQFSASQKRKKLFVTASLVPILVFFLEIFSMFLGDKTRVCQTSKDPNVVKSPSLRLFRDGEREVDVVDLNDEIIGSGGIARRCSQRQSTYSVVDYIASVCSDLLRGSAPTLIVKTFFPENDRISISVLKSFKSGKELLMSVFSRQPKSLLSNSTLVGFFRISSEVSVNGKSVLDTDVIKDFVINEAFTKEILNDVRVLEKEKNSTTSEFMENSDFFKFEWADLNDLSVGAANVIFSLMWQSRRVESKTAAELSSLNVKGILPELDTLCEEDFFLPRTVSIIIIITASVLRLVLIAVPTSISSAQYLLMLSQEGEGHESFAESTKEQPRITLS